MDAEALRKTMPPHRVVLRAPLDERQQALVPHNRELALVVHETVEVRHQGVHDAARQGVPVRRNGHKRGEAMTYLWPASPNVVLY